MKNPLLAEIWDYRERYAASFNYDVRAMGQALRKKEQLGGRKLAKRAVRRIKKQNLAARHGFEP